MNSIFRYKYKNNENLWKGHQQDNPALPTEKNSFDLCKKFFYLFFYFDTINVIFLIKQEVNWDISRGEVLISTEEECLSNLKSLGKMDVKIKIPW